MKFYKSIFFILLISSISSCSPDQGVGPSLSIFSPLVPADKTNDLSPGFQFEWEESNNAVSYELFIGQDPLIADTIISDISGTSVTVENLRYGRTYYWQVSAFDELDNQLKSSRFKFSTKKNYAVLWESLYMPQLGRSRRISLYLPPNYENETKSYPVLYMHDGQALFDTDDYPYEEWEVDDTLDRLYQEIGFNLIVVAIDNINSDERLTEYSPWVNTGQITQWAQWSEGLGGLGDEYIEFIVENLKPRIDANYRTLTDKENTGILGSSMGGLISCYAGLAYPDVFGKIGVYSPSFWFSEGGIYDLASASAPQLNNNKFYFLAGDSETSIIDLPQEIQDFMDTLTTNNVPESNMIRKIVPGGKHEEYLWREGFEETIRWLFIE